MKRWWSGPMSVIERCALLAGIAALPLHTGAYAQSIERGAPSTPLAVLSSQPASVPVTHVCTRSACREIRLPSELSAFRNVSLYPRVQGFVDWIGVDRGALVTKGECLIRLVAPELAARRGEAAAKWLGAKAQALEAEARSAADTATYNRLQSAARSPGVVAGNDVEIARRTQEASRAHVQACRELEQAARQAVAVQAEIEGYLHVCAPFDGVITERNVHEGSLVGPTYAGVPPLRIQDVTRLRLTVPVPEADVAVVHLGESVQFDVPAFPGRTFHGTVSRAARALDVRTRTMPVEIDVDNRAGDLAPGMYAQVRWMATRPGASLVVPVTAVATTTERTFVVAIRQGRAVWVDVKRGAVLGDQVEVFGDLAVGEPIAVRGSDEIRQGMAVLARPPASPSPVLPPAR